MAALPSSFESWNWAETSKHHRPSYHHMLICDRPDQFSFFVCTWLPWLPLYHMGGANKDIMELNYSGSSQYPCLPPWLRMSSLAHSERHLRIQKVVGLTPSVIQSSPALFYLIWFLKYTYYHASMQIKHSHNRKKKMTALYFNTMCRLRNWCVNNVWQVLALFLRCNLLRWINNHQSRTIFKTPVGEKTAHCKIRPTLTGLSSHWSSKIKV